MRFSHVIPFAVLALVCIEGAASAYCRTTSIPVPPDFDPSQGCWTQGAPLYWPSACVGYSMSRVASKEVDYPNATRVMASAFSAWTGAHCANGAPSITLLALGPTDTRKVEYNKDGPNENVIFFQDDAWPHGQSDESLALTTLTFDAQGPTAGRILDGDLEINTAQHAFVVSGAVPADGYDLATVLAHEAGHFLGLAHTTDADAVMYAAYTPGTSRTQLVKDDIDAVCTVYPPDATRPTAAGQIPATSCTFTPSNGASSGSAPCAPTVSRACSVSAPGATRGAEGFVAALAVVAFAFGRRIRTKNGR